MHDENFKKFTNNTIVNDYVICFGYTKGKNEFEGSDICIFKAVLSNEIDLAHQSYYMLELSEDVAEIEPLVLPRLFVHPKNEIDVYTICHPYGLGKKYQKCKILPH